MPQVILYYHAREEKGRGESILVPPNVQVVGLIQHGCLLNSVTAFHGCCCKNLSCSLHVKHTQFTAQEK
jgi:hypothetical protein